MIKVENVETSGWKAAIRGMRNPMNSWDQSDSIFDYSDNIIGSIGPKDLDLMKRLIKGGSEERKFLRTIHVQMDIVAPLYWWKEFDTYKVATVANSCSTMHKIAAKEFTVDDFSHEHLLKLDDAGANSCMAVDVDGNVCHYSPEGFLKMTINVLNGYRQFYLETKDKKYWWQMIQLLPTSYNQRRTVDFSYETALRMIHQRRNHKLDEWRTFCLYLFNLPYMEKLYDD